MRRLHPATILVALLPKLREAIQSAIPVFIASCASGHSGNQEWIAIFIAVFTGVFAIGAYWTTTFDIDGDHVSHRTGWIFRKDRRIPLVQIQNVNLRQNVLERLLKVATVDVETAMGKGRDLKLSVLSIGDAEKFREELLAAAHLGETPATPESRPVITLTQHDLLLGAVTENHVGQMIFGMFFVCGPLFGVIGSSTKSLSPEMKILVFTGGLGLLVIVGWIWGAASYYLKYGGFSVRRDENAFRISYGLLNKAQIVIRPSRIEFLTIASTIFQRWMDRANFRVATASTFGESGQFAPVALFVERYRAYQSAAEVIPGLDLSRVQWRGFEPVFYRVAAVRTLIFVAVVGVAGWLVASAATEDAAVIYFICGMLSILPLSNFIGLLLSMKENGFALADDALVTRRGYLTQTISAIPIHRMENINVTQPFWWKNYRCASVAVQAMKQRIGVGAMPMDAVEELLTKWQAKIEAEGNLEQPILDTSPDPDPVMSEFLA